MSEMQDTSIFVFGYGSMVNPNSIRKSLPHVTDESMRMAWLEDFERSWTAVFDIDSLEYTPPRIARVAFLNVTPVPQKRINGILFPVTTEELAVLDRREKTYDRLDVTRLIKPTPPGTVYVYGQPPGVFSPEDILIPAKYIQIVKDGCAHWGAEFSEEFQKTTLPFEGKIIKGEYRFRDEQQNQATGRSR